MPGISLVAYGLPSLSRVPPAVDLVEAKAHDVAGLPPPGLTVAAAGAGIREVARGLGGGLAGARMAEATARSVGVAGAMVSGTAGTRDATAVVADADGVVGAAVEVWS
ncbi:hypothetical protein ACIBOV_28120 [Micromonospora chersina]|uniref:hypothetical protein n=1 Tax=Micromonospora chersina TaxID=47854 RepID=UPI00378C4382